MPEKEILRPYKRLRELTPKDRRYVNELVKGKPKTEAAKIAGFKYPPQAEEIKRAIVRVMDKAGLTDCKLVRRLKKFVFKAKDEDNAIKALRMALELKDHFPADRKAPAFAQQINIYQGVEESELKARVRELIEGTGEEKSKERPLLPHK